jgi:hypothetical protein
MYQLEPSSHESPRVGSDNRKTALESSFELPQRFAVPVRRHLRAQ